MGENEDMGWFPEYLKVKEFILPKGTEIIPKEEFMKELVGKPLDVEFDIPNCKVSYKDGMIVVDELTKLPKDMIRSNILTDDADFKHLSEETAQQIHKAFENIQMTMEKDFPMAFTKRKARKHYKPKFTL